MRRNDFLKQTRQRLIGRRDALRRALAGDMSMLRSEHDATAGDEVDAAIATEQAELRSQLASFESRELAQIENALDKIRRGRYGHCDSCDKPINSARLSALPYATECINCARSGEHRTGQHSGVADRNSPINRIAAYTGE